MMSNVKENIIKAFNKKHPDLHVNFIMDYNNKAYIVNATEKPNDMDTFDPYFIVYKQTGEINVWIPDPNDDEFFDAYEHRRL